MNTEQAEYLANAVTKLKEEGFSLHLFDRHHKVTDDDGVKANGFLDYGTFKFVLSTKKPFRKWWAIFLHEYQHFLQHLDGMFTNQSDKQSTYIWQWLLYEREFEKHQVFKAIDSVRGIELDCERRVLAAIKNSPLLLNFQGEDNTPKYIQKANAYLFYYTSMMRTRKWYVKAPYDVPEVLALCSSTKLAKDYNRMPRGYLKAVKQYCI